jgi:hypothetical protein
VPLVVVESCTLVEASETRPGPEVVVIELEIASIPAYGTSLGQSYVLVFLKKKKPCVLVLCNDRDPINER